MGTEAPRYVCLFSCQFLCDIPDGLVIHARNSGELSWPDIERKHNLSNNTFSYFIVMGFLLFFSKSFAD